MTAPAMEVNFSVYIFLVLNIVISTVVPLLFIFYMNLRRDAEVTPAIIGAAFYLIAFVLMSFCQSAFFQDGAPAFWAELPAAHSILVSAVTSLIEVAVLVLGVFFIARKGDRDDAVSFGVGFAAVKTTFFVSIRALADITVASKAAAGKLGEMANNEETLANLVEKVEFMSRNGGVGYLADTLEALVTLLVLTALSVMVFSSFSGKSPACLFAAAGLYLVYGAPSMLFSAGLFPVSHAVSVLLTLVLGAGFCFYVWKFHFTKLPDPLAEWNERRRLQKEKELRRQKPKKGPNPYEIKRK